MSGIFVSYRRSGASVVTYRLVDELQRLFGEESIFLDQESIEPGLPFAEAIQKSLQQCSVALIIIGPQWVNMTNDKGEKRLDNPDDWVRQEVALALNSNVRVVPLLVQGAEMPEFDELPDEISKLSSLQAFAISDSQAHWSFDVDRLADKLMRIAPQLSRFDQSQSQTHQQNTSDQNNPTLNNQQQNFQNQKSQNQNTLQPQLTYSYKAIIALVLCIFAILGLAENSTDQDTLIGAAIFFVVAVILCAFAYMDIRLGKVKGRGLVISTSVLCCICSFYTLGLLNQSSTSQTATPAIAKVNHLSSTQSVKPQVRQLNLSGAWSGPDGSSYRISQSGKQVSFIEYNAFGAEVGRGSGDLQGKQYTFNYYNSLIGLNANGSAIVNAQAMNVSLYVPATGLTNSLTIYRQ